MLIVLYFIVFCFVPLCKKSFYYLECNEALTSWVLLPKLALNISQLLVVTWRVECEFAFCSDIV